MSNPVAKRDLVDSILELRAEAEQQLMRNKYYLAIVKLDELLEQIRPLEAEENDADRGEPTAPSDASKNPAEHAVGSRSKRDAFDRNPEANAERDELGDEPDAEMLRKLA